MCECVINRVIRKRKCYGYFNGKKSEINVGLVSDQFLQLDKNTKLNTYRDCVFFV